MSSDSTSGSPPAPATPSSMETDQATPPQNASPAEQGSTPQPPPSSSSSSSSSTAPSTSQAPQGSGDRAGESSGQRNQTAPEAVAEPPTVEDIAYNWPFPQPHVWVQDGGYFMRESYEMYVSSDVPLKARQMLSLIEQKMLARERQLYPYDTITNRNISVMPLEPMQESDDEELLQGHETPKRRRNPRLNVPQNYRSAMISAEFYYGKLKKSNFVETKAHRRALDILIKNRSILIIGHDGDGKTTFGVWLLKKLAQQLDTDGLYMHHPADYGKAYCYPQRDPRVTMIDNILGSGYYSDSEVKSREWNEFKETYTTRFQYGQYLIFTSNIFHYQQHFKDVQHYDMMSNIPIFDLSAEENSFTFEEMQEILKKQCQDNYKADVSPELPLDVPRMGYPGRVNYFVSREDAFCKGMSYWTLHLEPYVSMLIGLSHGNTVYFSILIFMVTNNDRLNPEDFLYFDRWDTTKDDDKKMKQQIREDKGWFSSYFGDKFEKWLKCMDHMKGILVDFDKEEKVWKIINDTIRLAIFIVWGGRHFYSDFLRFVSRRFLVDHTYVDMQDHEFHSHVRRHHVHFDLWKGKTVMERMLKEILEGHVREMLLHRNFMEEDFVQAFLEKVREMDKMEEMLFVRNNEDDNMYAEPLLMTNISALEERRKDLEVQKKKKEEEEKAKENKEPKETNAQKEEKKKKRMEKLIKEDKAQKGPKGRRMLTIATSFGLSRLIQAILLLREMKEIVREDWFQEDLVSAAALAEKLELQYLKTILQSFLLRPRETSMELDATQS